MCKNLFSQSTQNVKNTKYKNARSDEKKKIIVTKKQTSAVNQSVYQILGRLTAVLPL